MVDVIAIIIAIITVIIIVAIQIYDKHTIKSGFNAAVSAYLGKDDYPYYTKIDDNIILGSKYVTNDELINMGVTNVVSILAQDNRVDMPTSKWNRSVSAHIAPKLEININDLPIEDIIAAAEKAVPYINSVVKNGGKVYVHCVMGISRSASIVIAYYMAKNKWDYYRAFNYVSAIRPIIQPNIGFELQLSGATNSLDKLYALLD